jgi:CheY-like chemotaxis protein
MRRKSEVRNGPDPHLADKYPLNFLVAEDNKINRKLLVSMLRKLGYTSVREAYDGADAVRQMAADFETGRDIDVILMDLWMPYMDGYEATEKILSMRYGQQADGFTSRKIPTILAVTADVTDGALERAAKAGMKGFMTKPYKLVDLEKLIVEYCTSRTLD